MSSAAVASSDDRIVCKIDNALTHSIKIHIRKHHAADWSVERYEKEFPGAPLMSEYAKDAVRMSKAKQAAEAADVGPRRAMSELFNMPPEKLKNSRGDQITVRYFDPKDLSDEDRVYLPAFDPNYVYPIELTKSVLMSFELNLPLYLWGLHGSGKSTLPEQASCITGRPFMRVQHTVNTEESHILGQMVVETDPDSGTAITRFALGPLPIAMLNGYVYCADEYDFALPHVTAVYQPVLEGKSLIIKEAPLEYRVIKPHPNFRFVGTGNTNGGGDDTGLYQGTQIQNAANYSRFGITEEVDYPEPKVEATIIAGQAGIRLDDARKLVEFGTEVRKAFTGRTISSTISPRELINAGKLGLVRGDDWRGGIMQAFANRLSRTDREVITQYCQRIFG